MFFGVQMQIIRKTFGRILLGLFFVSIASHSYAEAPRQIEGVTTVNLSNAKYLFDRGAVFIDVRHRDDWSLGHIKGAINLDFNDSEFSVLFLSPELDRSTPIVFYNSSSINISGALASFFATNWGYSNVYFFREGFYSWMAADLPVELKMLSRM